MSFNVVFNQWGAVPDVYHVTLDFEDDSYYLIDENSINRSTSRL